MKKLNLIITSALIGASALLMSCGGSNINYNDTVVDVFDKYNTKVNSFSTTILSDTASVANKESAVAAITKLTDSCTDVMSKLKPSEEGKGFHEAVINVYKGVKAELIPVYGSLAVIDKPEANVDAYNKAVEEYDKAFNNVDVLMDKAIKEQEDFAKKVNMKIKN